MAPTKFKNIILKRSCWKMSIVQLSVLNFHSGMQFRCIPECTSNFILSFHSTGTHLRKVDTQSRHVLFISTGTYYSALFRIPPLQQVVENTMQRQVVFTAWLVSHRNMCCIRVYTFQIISNDGHVTGVGDAFTWNEPSIEMNTISKCFLYPQERH